MPRGKQLRIGRFVQQTFHLGVEQKFQWDKALAIACATEDEDSAESSRRKVTRPRHIRAWTK